MENYSLAICCALYLLSQDIYFTLKGVPVGQKVLWSPKYSHLKIKVCFLIWGDGYICKTWQVV